MTEPTPPAASLADVLAWAPSGEARRELRILLLGVLQRPAAWLYTHPDACLDARQLQAIAALWQRRQAGEPVAYLLGEREFYGIPLYSTAAALIPRADTELLVEVAAALCAAHPAPHLLDLGTGTGAIAIALALQRPELRVTATDRMPAALELARRNVQRHHLAMRITLSQGDWLDATGGQRFDGIVSNPPYIAAGDPHLTQGDLRFEPASALASGPTGLDDLTRIIRAAPDHLHPGGWLALEHGYDQAPAVAQLLADRGYTGIQTRQDLAGHDRVTAGHWTRAI